MDRIFTTVRRPILDDNDDELRPLRGWRLRCAVERTAVFTREEEVCFLHYHPPANNTESPGEPARKTPGRRP